MSDQWRQLALEVVVTMSETAPATVRKAGKFITLLGWFDRCKNIFSDFVLCLCTKHLQLVLQCNPVLRGMAQAALWAQTAE